MNILRSHMASILVPSVMKPLPNQLQSRVLIALLLTLGIAPVGTARAGVVVLGQFNPPRWADW